MKVRLPLVGGFYGFMFGGPVGAFMGMVVGGILEQNSSGAGSGRASYSKPSKDAARNPFFTTTFQVMGWLSEHAIKHATTQTREITVAYLCIRNARGFRA